MKVKSAKSKISSEDKIHGELEAVRGMLARALADYDNLSRRTERERGDLMKIASVGLVVRLLPILDSLENAQEHLKDQGLAILIGEFKKVLAEEGLTEIRSKEGEDFDENTMEVTEVVEGGEKGKVAKLVIPGWQFTDGQVVRVAKVTVFN